MRASIISFSSHRHQVCDGNFMMRNNIYPIEPLDHPHPPLVLQRSTPTSLQVVALVPNFKLFDLVSSTFICNLSCWSYLHFYFNFLDYSQRLFLSTRCCLCRLINYDSFLYSASLCNLAAANLRLQSSDGSAYRKEPISLSLNMYISSFYLTKPRVVSNYWICLSDMILFLMVLLVVLMPLYFCSIGLDMMLDNDGCTWL